MKNDEQKAITPHVKSAPKYDLDLDAVEQKDSKFTLPSHTGLTLRQWQELSKKDPALLTPLQKHQLAETNKMFIETFKRLSETYDFSGLYFQAKTTCGSLWMAPNPLSARMRA